MANLTPANRNEIFLSAAGGQSVELPTPVTRKEMFLAAAAGESVEKPTPITREEMFLDAIESGGGGGEAVLINKTVSANGTYNASRDSADGYKKVTVNVPNSYEAGDEGKVVSNGALVAQTAHAQVTSNGTIDTTLNNSVEVNVPSGPQLIASGTFTGTGTHTLDLFVGKKMAQTNFIFNIWVENGTQITPSASSDRIPVICQCIYQGRFCHYDLSSDGAKNIVNLCTYPTDNGSGTFVDRTPSESAGSAAYVRTTTIANEVFSLLTVGGISRDATGFTLHYSKNAQYPWVSGVTYNWEIIYIGSNAASDIVEVA